MWGRDQSERDLFYGTQSVARPGRDLASRLANPQVRLFSAAHMEAMHARRSHPGSVSWPATPLVETSDDGATLEPVIFGSIVLTAEQRRRHCLVVGATGAGKTYIHAAGAIAETLRSTGENLIINNTKGPAGTAEIASIVRAARPGTRVLVFAPGDPKRSLACNFVKLARTHGLTGLLLRFILDTMPQGSQDSGFWKSVAERMIGAALKCPEIESLAALYELFQEARLLREFGKLVFDLRGDRTFEDFISYHNSGSQNAATNLADIGARIAPFCTSDAVRAVTSGPHELDFATLLKDERPFVLIVECNEVNFSTERQSLGLFFTLFFASVLKVAEENRGMLPRPAHFFIDEFGTIGRIPDFESIVNVGRSRGFAITALVQSISQIGATYGMAADSVLAGFNTKVFFCSGLSRLDREFASSLGGSIAVREWRRTEQSMATGEEWHSAARTEHTILRPLIAPDDLLLCPHPVFGGYAYAFIVDYPPMLAHFTPSWEQPIAGPAIEAAHGAGASYEVRESPLPVVPLHGHIEPVLREHNSSDLPLDRSVCQMVLRKFTNTRRMNRALLQITLNRRKESIGWAEASEEVKKHWKEFERRSKERPSDIVRLAEEIMWRSETMTSFYEASMQAKTQDVTAILHYMDYLRLRRKEQEREEAASGPKEHPRVRPRQEEEATANVDSQNAAPGA